MMSEEHSDAPSMRVLTFGGIKTERHTINLRDLGFVGRVSEAARAEIKANARRAQRVLTTAHLYWFGGR
jgi:hypothetical protein